MAVGHEGVYPESGGLARCSTLDLVAGLRRLQIQQRTWADSRQLCDPFGGRDARGGPRAWGIAVAMRT
jgi:hypothetical protein